MSCSLKYRFAKQNAKNRLMKSGAIDQYNNIINDQVFNQQSNIINRYGKSEYNIDAKLVQRDDINPAKAIFNLAAFKAVDILKGVSNEDAIDNNTLEHLNQARGASYASPSFADIFNTSSSVPAQGLTRLVNLKESLLDRANKRLSETKRKLKESKDDITEYNELLKLQTQLTDYIEGNESKQILGLKEEIQDLLKIDTRAPEIIAPYIEKEFERLDTLVQSTDPDHTSEAQDIITFIKDMSKFDRDTIATSPLGHPLYHYDELYDSDGNFLLTDAMLQSFIDWAARADSYQRALATQYTRIIENQYNDNSKVKQLYGDKKFTYEEIVSSGVGLKDTNWIDMMVMDVTSGIFSHNGLMPQVIKNIVEKELEKEYAWSKNIAERVDNLLPKVQAELKKLGYGLDSIGILGTNAVRYDLFKQVFETGQQTGNMAHKYSGEWFEALQEMQMQHEQSMDNARKSTDADAKRTLFKQAMDRRNAWNRKNTKLMNPALLSEIISDPAFSSLASYFTYSNNEVQAHESEIKALIGDQHYDSLIESQKHKLVTYMAQRQNTLDKLMQDEGATDFTLLTPQSQRAFEIWEAEYNPFKTAQYRATGAMRIGVSDYHSRSEYNESVPLHTQFYDKNYAQIEANPVLKEFHDLIHEASSSIKDRLPHSMQAGMLSNSIPSHERTMMEMLVDKDLDFWTKISDIFRKFWDDIVSAFGVNVQNSLSAAKVNPNTGLPDYKVNSDFIKLNKNKIDDIFFLKATKFIQDMGLSTAVPMTKFRTFSLSLFRDANKLKILNEAAGTNFTFQELKDQYPDSIDIAVGKLLHRASQHEVAQENSFDLPKIIKLYTHLTAQYSARQQMLPLINLMKDHYNTIKRQVTQNSDTAITNLKTKVNYLGGERSRGEAQMEDWFQRVVLGNYGLKKHYGVGDKIYNKSEKEQLEAINDLISKTNDDDAGKDQKEDLEKIKDKLGRNFAASAIVDNIFSFIRFKGLAFNLSSGINNFIEGQVANSITAASGNYFPPEFIHELSPSEMIAGDFMKQRNPASQSEKTAKAEFLAKATNILQDNTNELQKASNKSAFARLRRLNPFYMTAKGEQYNQIPLMAAMLKNTPITGISGTVSNVWDALEGVYLPDSKQWTVKLKDDFKTGDNVSSWENYQGEDFLNWKAGMTRVIINTHGNYSETSGMMAKSSHVGQAFMAFKTWLPTEIYKRFAMQQDDLATGIKGFKGRWRSHTPVSAAMQAGLMGTYFLGPVGGLVGAGAGYAAGRFFGAQTNLSLLQELMMTNKLLFRKLIGMPVNLIGSVVTKKRVNTQLSDHAYADMEGARFSKQDFNNFRGNIQEMSIMMSFFGLLLLTKAATWDDDDDAESLRRRTHNLLANRFMSLASSGMMYANLIDLHKTVLEPAFLKFITDGAKLVSDFSKAVHGDDTLLTGINAGQSRSINQLKKVFLPGILSDVKTGGLDKQMDMQFQPSHYDSYFWGEEKEAKRSIQEMKILRKTELESTGEMTEDQIEKQLRREFPRRKKGQSFSDKLKQLEAVEEE